MKIKTIYTCEICGCQSEDKVTIEKCEARGVPDLNKYPIGMIFGNASSSDHFHSGMTFAIKHLDNYNSHSITATKWACRNWGDTLGDEGCGTGTGFVIPIGNLDYIPDKNHPTFQRMVNFLLEYFEGDRSKITCWNGTKPVSLDEFLLY